MIDVKDGKTIYSYLPAGHRGMLLPEQKRSEASLHRLLIYFCLIITAPAVFAQSAIGAPFAAPDLRVPETSVPYAVDEYQGTTELVAIHHSRVRVNRHNGANFAGSATESFFYRAKTTTELDGPHARVQLHNVKPVIYLHVGDEDPDHSGDAEDSYTSTWAIVHVSTEKNHRVIAKVTMNAFGGQAKRKDGMVPMTTERLPAAGFGCR